MKSTLLRPVLTILLAATGLFLTSCSTTEGFGRDLQKVGNKIENKADQAQRGY